MKKVTTREERELEVMAARIINSALSAGANEKQQPSQQLIDTFRKISGKRNVQNLPLPKLR